MGDKTSIAWCDHTFNPWIGCTKVSTGCTNCYASVDTYARVQRSRGRELWGPRADRHITSEANWRKPIAWNRAAETAGERRRVFCASLGDVFEDRPDLEAPRARLWKLIRYTPYLDWLLLTKRPENAQRLWCDAAADANADGNTSAWLPNMWLGTTVEDQPRADERISRLLATPAAVRFLSLEPLLGDVDLSPWLQFGGGRPCLDASGYEMSRGSAPRSLLDWVIVGGESGPGARPCDVAWIRDVVRQCREAGTACFVKQFGARPIVGTRGVAGFTMGQLDASDSRHGDDVVLVRLRDHKGSDPSEWPEDLRVREFPEVRR